MATNYLEPGALPEGVVVAHTLHGEPDTSVQLAHHVNSADVQPAPDSGVPYYLAHVVSEERPAVAPVVEPVPVSLDETVEPELTPPEDVPERAPGRDKRCHAKDDTCMGWAIRDSTYCAAHAGLFNRG